MMDVNERTDYLHSLMVARLIERGCCHNDELLIGEAKDSDVDNFIESFTNVGWLSNYHGRYFLSLKFFDKVFDAVVERNLVTLWAMGVIGRASGKYYLTHISHLFNLSTDFIND